MKTRYRNTDLDLKSDGPLDQLIQALEAEGMCLLSHHQVANGDWFAVLEIVGKDDGDLRRAVDTTTCAILDLLEGLPRHNRVRLEQCKTREFNATFDVGDAPYDFTTGLSVQTISRIAALNASFRVTLYPGDEQH